MKWTIIGLFIIYMFIGCINQVDTKDEKDFSESLSKREDYIREIQGKDEDIDVEFIERGEVMISYSACNSCHNENKKQIGPSFKDINLRYPRQQVFIKILAQRIIHGGSGAWGQAKMSAHPKLETKDAEAMVSYILSIPTVAEK